MQYARSATVDHAPSGQNGDRRDAAPEVTATNGT